MLRQATQNLITALYPRLSHEDELQGESIPYRTRKGFWKPTPSRTALPICAGTPTTAFPARTSSAPGFQAMLADIEAGKVGTVIVKDMSRLGRNYLQVGFYTEMLFPQKGVRFYRCQRQCGQRKRRHGQRFYPSAKSVQRMAGERYEQENQSSKTSKRHEWKACYQQAGIWLSHGRGRELSR